MRDILALGALILEAEWCLHSSVNQTIIGSDNCLSPNRRQAIISTDTGILSIGLKKITEIYMKLQQLSYKEIN